MITRQQIGVIVGVFVAGAACGYFALPAKVITKTETKVVTQLVQDTTQNQAQHIKVVVVAVHKPDGTQITTTTKTQDSDIKSKTDTNEHQDSDKESSKVVTYSKNALSLSVLASYRVGDTGFNYGLFVNKEVFGPFTLGIFGLTNKTLGASVGIMF